MALSPSAVESRSNSDLLATHAIVVDTSMSAPERMELLRRVVAGWDAATAGSTGRYTAEKVSNDRIRYGLAVSHCA